MAQTTPQEAARRWGQNMQAASETMKAGANAVTVSPMEQAAAQADVWLMRLNESKQKWVDGLRRSNLQDWKSAYINKGVPRITQSVQLAMDKVLRFQQEWIPFARNVAEQLPPRGNLEQNIARMNENVRRLAGFRRTR